MSNSSTAASTAGACAECGQPFELDAYGVSFHLTEDGSCDYDTDRDHVPYG